MIAAAMYEVYCNNFAPQGPYGITVEDVQTLVDKYNNTFGVMKMLHERKCAMVDEINRERNNNR